MIRRRFVRAPFCRQFRSYKLPFRFTGAIDKLTINVGREQLTDNDRERTKRAVAAAHD
jgi:hypothetical protein